MNPTAIRPGLRWGRVPLLLLGIAALVCGVLGGLLRLPVTLPAVRAEWALLHGPLMVCAFLGTVISLERAVGLPDRWPYLAPIVIGSAGAHLLAGGPGRYGILQLLAGNLVFLAVTLRVIRMRCELFTVVMGTGAAAWAVGNTLWFAGRPLYQVMPWWTAFLGLTIIGERIDLSRFQRQVPAARPLFLVFLAAFVAGVVLSAWDDTRGQRLMGVGMVLLAGWLGVFDLARRTLPVPGLPRFMSISLLGGFAWLAVAGILFVTHAPLMAGTAYDAALHAFFVGFVFSMIFGHAPVIFPSVLGLTAVWRPRFHIHLALLHLSLGLRLAGDLAGSIPVRQAGGILNAVAIGVFLLNTVTALAGDRRQARRNAKPQPASPS